MEFVGRKEETKTMLSLLNSEKSEFLAVYGRRRVGKTFLIRSVYKDYFTFQMTGLANVTLKTQLDNFRAALQKVSSGDTPKVSSWFSAFQQLEQFLENSGDGKKVIFIDELPWFDTRKSGFIQALEHFWNSWASARNDILLVVCGSAASWMINKLINSHGGLHNRVTKRIRLAPFSLAECELYLQAQNIALDRYQILQLYMALGGIPFYWDEIQPGLSAMQNIGQVCFTENGLLRTEFTNLLTSLFNKADAHKKIVNVLATKAMGLSRDDILQATGLANAGSTTRILQELEESGFIRRYAPFGRKRRNSLYQLSDTYSLFYFKFIKDTQPDDGAQWLSMLDSPKYRAWSGYAFEQICLYHIFQIKKALGISGVQTTTSAWRSKNQPKNAQIDLVINRRDHIINLCEIKFSMYPFTVTKSYAEELRLKTGIFKTETNTRKAVFTTLITTFGLQENMHSQSSIQNAIDMNALFE